MDFFVINLLNGLSYSVILFLFAAAMTLICGAMGLLNLGHGAMYMVGAYVGWTIAVKFGLNYGLAILAGGLAVGLVGLAVHQGLLQYLYRQFTEQVLITLGLIYVLGNATLWIWGGEEKAPFTAGVFSGGIPVMGWMYPIHRLAVIFIGVGVAIFLWWLQDKTRVGAIIRAGMDDREMVGGLGINLRLVSILTFFIATFILGAAGVIGSGILGVALGVDQTALFMSLVVVTVGGIGSVQGALLGAIIIGLVDAFGKALFPELSYFFIYSAMIIVLMIRPAGLLGRLIYY